jgi:hypothetical protein
MSLAERQLDNPESAAREVPGDASGDADLAPLSQSAAHDVESGKPNDATESGFSSKEKWFIVSLASLAALFSPFTANIYLPVIPAVSRDFHKSRAH